MDPVFAKRLLGVLIENARRILAAGFGVNWAESAFFDVVRLLRQQPELKDCFLDRVRATFASRVPASLKQDVLPVELIELVAHEFRWPELKEIADLRISRSFPSDPTFAIGDVAYRVLQAFSDDWADRAFYERYSQK